MNRCSNWREPLVTDAIAERNRSLLSWVGASHAPPTTTQHDDDAVAQQLEADVATESHPLTPPLVDLLGGVQLLTQEQGTGQEEGHGRQPLLGAW